MNFKDILPKMAAFQKEKPYKHEKLYKVEIAGNGQTMVTPASNTGKISWPESYGLAITSCIDIFICYVMWMTAYASTTSSSTNFHIMWTYTCWKLTF